MNKRQLIRLCLLVGVTLPVSVLTQAREPYRPQVEPANFSTNVNLPWYPLKPGTVMVYTEKEDDEVRTRIVTVSHETKVVMGVKCVIVHQVVTAANGRAEEETDDCYAQDKQGNVWYFGEAARVFKGLGAISNEGSWEAGVKSAQPGVVMPAHPTPGPAYRQGYLANVVEDMGQVMALNETVTVPFGIFTGCVRTKEWSLLESGNDKKWYAKGIGLIRAESTGGEMMTLISVEHH